MHHKSSSSQLSYANTGGHQLRNKSGERNLGGRDSPIDIFVHVDTPP